MREDTVKCLGCVRRHRVWTRGRGGFRIGLQIICPQPGPILTSFYNPSFGSIYSNGAGFFHVTNPPAVKTDGGEFLIFEVDPDCL